MTQQSAIQKALRDLDQLDAGTHSTRVSFATRLDSFWTRHESTIRAALQSAKLPEWRTIDSAPRDVPIVGVWKDGKWYSAVVWYDTSVDEWTHYSGDYYCPIEYWQPLPAPPNGGGG